MSRIITAYQPVTVKNQSRIEFKSSLKLKTGCKLGKLSAYRIKPYICNKHKAGITDD